MRTGFQSGADGVNAGVGSIDNVADAVASVVATGGGCLHWLQFSSNLLSCSRSSDF